MALRERFINIDELYQRKRLRDDLSYLQGIEKGRYSISPHKIEKILRRIDLFSRRAIEIKTCQLMSNILHLVNLYFPRESKIGQIAEELSPLRVE